MHHHKQEFGCLIPSKTIFYSLAEDPITLVFGHKDSQNVKLLEPVFPRLLQGRIEFLSQTDDDDMFPKNSLMLHPYLRVNIAQLE